MSLAVLDPFKEPDYYINNVDSAIKSSLRTSRFRSQLNQRFKEQFNETDFHLNKDLPRSLNGNEVITLRGNNSEELQAQSPNQIEEVKNFVRECKTDQMKGWLAFCIGQGLPIVFKELINLDLAKRFNSDNGSMFLVGDPVGRKIDVLDDNRLFVGLKWRCQIQKMPTMEKSEEVLFETAFTFDVQKARLVHFQMTGGEKLFPPREKLLDLLETRRRCDANQLVPAVYDQKLGEVFSEYPEFKRCFLERADQIKQQVQQETEGVGSNFSGHNIYLDVQILQEILRGMGHIDSDAILENPLPMQMLLDPSPGSSPLSLSLSEGEDSSDEDSLHNADLIMNASPSRTEAGKPHANNDPLQKGNLFEEEDHDEFAAFSNPFSRMPLAARSMVYNQALE